MNIPQTLPITPLQSKAARYQLGLTQANVIGESGLPGHKLKNFETGRFIPDIKFLESLRTFFEGKGIDLQDLSTSDQVPITAPGAPPMPAPAQRPGANLVAPMSRPAFLISTAIDQDQVDSLLEAMDANDNRIEAIMDEPGQSGMLSGRADLLQRELFGLMAANYLLFRMMQGRNIVGTGQRDADQRTVGDMLRLWVERTPFALLLAGQETPQVVAAAQDSGVTA